MRKTEQSKNIFGEWIPNGDPHKVRTLPFLHELAESKGYEIRQCTHPLEKNESFNNVILPFDFSEKYGGTIDSFHYYNNSYLYPVF